MNHYIKNDKSTFKNNIDISKFIILISIYHIHYIPYSL